MDKHPDILYWLARFLAEVPPDTLGAMVLFALEHPEVMAALCAVALFLLKLVVVVVLSILKFVVLAILGSIVTWYVVKMIGIHAWPKLPPNLQRLLRRAEERALLKGAGRDRPAVRRADSTPSKYNERHPHW